MIKSSFKPNLRHTAVAYLRMSTELQNPRSPEQQLKEINRTLRRLGLSWDIVKTYTDPACSGRLTRRRPALQQMFRDIETGAVTPSLILVDTIERFGRGDDRKTIQRRLKNKHGVLVLTANNGFADPTTLEGQIVSDIKDIQARAENETKAHNVLRGKRDVVEQKKWPGGPIPFGFQLEGIFEERNGQTTHTGSRLIHDPSTVPIVRLLFNEAKQTGFGQTRLARHMNEHPDVPEAYKPMSHHTVGRRLSNPLYKGEFIFGKNATDLIDDRRIQASNDVEDIIHVTDYCKPIVSPEVWDEVNELRRERSKKTPSKKKRPEGAVLALSGGIVLENPLSGLVFCGECGTRRMSPSSGGLYTRKTGDQAGEEVRYVYYTCPGSRDKTCSNTIGVKESWLRNEVLNSIRQRLFPDDSKELDDQPFIREILEEVNANLVQLSTIPDDQCKVLEAEMNALEKKITGWQMTLGNPELPQAVRNDITKQYETAADRRNEIEIRLGTINAHKNCLADTTSEKEVRERLKKLSDVLPNESPTQLSMELSLVIDSISVFQDGKIVMKTCKLGLLDDIVRFVDLAAGIDLDLDDSCDLPHRRRRRPKLAVDTLTGPEELEDLEYFATDTYRFAGLSDKWFWFDEFRQPEPTWWSKEHAAEVAQMRATGMTHESLAEYFGVTVPTIRKALKYAAEQDPAFRELPRKMPRARWHEEHALEVADLAEENMTTMELAEHFGKSDTTIRKAKEHAAELKASSSNEKRKAGLEPIRKLNFPYFLCVWDIVIA